MSLFCSPRYNGTNFLREKRVDRLARICSVYPLSFIIMFCVIQVYSRRHITADQTGIWYSNSWRRTIRTQALECSSVVPRFSLTLYTKCAINTAQLELDLCITRKTSEPWWRQYVTRCAQSYAHAITVMSCIWSSLKKNVPVEWFMCLVWIGVPDPSY